MTLKRIRKKKREMAKTEPKTMVYEFLFHYSGDDTFEGNIILGASIRIAARVYKDGEEIKFIDEPECNNKHLGDVFRVSVDRKNVFAVKKNGYIEKLFCECYGFERIEAEVIGYSFDQLYLFPENEGRPAPQYLEGVSCTNLMEISEDEFKEFISIHIDDFDIPENMNVQAPAVVFV